MFNLFRLVNEERFGKGKPKVFQVKGLCMGKASSHPPPSAPPHQIFMNKSNL